MADTEVDKVLAHLGGYSRYQMLIWIAMGLVNVTAAWHMFVYTFVGRTPKHHCTPFANHTLSESIPQEENDNGKITWSKCSTYWKPGREGVPHSNDTTSCQNGWTYVWDKEGETSIVSDWDLVCGDSYLYELSITMHMVGATCGTLFLTPLSDRWGRKPVLLACLWVQAVVGVCLVFCQSVVTYIVLQFFIGITNMPIILCSSAMVAETFDGKTRESPSLSLSMFWAGGIMLLALLAYLLPQWRYLELAISLPQTLTLTYFWLLPESLTWLLNKGKIKRAKSVILTFLRVNKLPPIKDLDKTLDSLSRGLPSEDKHQQTVSKETQEKPVSESSGTEPANTDGTQGRSYTVLDLFKSARLCRNIVLMCYLNLVTSLGYYGITFSTPLLHGDIYLNTFISGAVEWPAHLICMICHRKFGRRRPISVSLLIYAAANIAVILTPDHSDSGTDLNTLKTALVMVGKFGIAGCDALDLYALEIFPTAIRNHGVGLCSFFENIGSIAAPLIMYASKMSKLPMTMFGAMAVLGAILIIFLPETHNRSLPQTIEEAENGGQLPENRQSAQKCEVHHAMDKKTLTYD